MPLPGDVSTFTLSFGPYTDATGSTAAAGTTGTLSPVDATGQPITVVHSGSGAVIVPAQIPITVEHDGTATIAGLAHTDDTHLSPQNFLYQVTWNVPAYRSTLVSKTFAAPTVAGATLDYDLLQPDGGTTPLVYAPVIVTSVNGHTGAVTLSASDVGADVAGAAAGKLTAASNLSDVANAATARTNLGLGSAATQPTSAFDASGAAAAAQAYAIQRANHTGTQPATTLTGLDLAVAGVVTPGGSATAAAIAADPAVKAAVDAEITAQGGGGVTLQQAVGVWRPVGLGALPPTSTTGTPSGSLTGGTGVKRIRSAVPLTAVKVRWGNFTTGNQESQAYGDLTIVAATIEYPAGVFYPLYIRGDVGALMKPGAIVESDEAAVIIPANTDFWVRTYCTWTAGATLALQDIRAINGQSASLSATPTDKTQQAGSVGGDTLAPAPVAVLGRLSLSTSALAVLGDSIATGTGDYPDFLRGYTDIACDGLTAVQKVSGPGERAQYEAMPTGRWRKARLIPGCTAAFEAYGVNDLSNGRTLAQTQADKITLWSWLRTIQGLRTVYTATLVPQTTSTDGWVTVSGQTPTSSETSRVALNDWLRDGAPLVSAANLTPAATGTVGALRAGSVGHPLSGYVELADVVEANSANTLTRNGGRWQVPSLRSMSDAAISSNSNVLTSATAAFTSADLGKVVTVAGAGSSGALFVSSIQIVTNATTVTLWTKAGTTVSGAAAKIGSPTADGIHPATPGHVAMSAPLAAKLPTILA